MRDHRLRREIIATVVANQLVDRAGTTFVFRLREETGAPPSLLARAYAVAREVFGMRDFWSAVEGLDNRVDAHIQLEMLSEARRLVERGARWLTNTHPHGFDVAELIEHFSPGARQVAAALPGPLEGLEREGFETRETELTEAGVPSALARRVAGMPATLSSLDIVAAAECTHRDLDQVSQVYFRLGFEFDLNWLRNRIIELPRANRWQALGRTALRNELYGLQRSLTEQVLESADPGADSKAAIAAWREAHAGAVKRCLSMVADIRASRTYDMTTLPVALREVRHLIRGGAEEIVGAGAL
jgi:glutamate dehydrogenase